MIQALAFPIAAIALTFFVLIPLASLVSRGLLSARRARVRRWVDFAGDSTLALLVAPTLLPLVWLVSSVLHQSEPAHALRACLVEHPLWTAICLEAFVLLALLGAGVGVAMARGVFQSRIPLGQPLGAEHELSRRLRQIVDNNPRLARLPIIVMQHAPAAIFTHGLRHPRVYVDACFARDNDDALLGAALLHEAAHARSRDPLRVFLVNLCLTLNPLGRLLRADFHRWQDAREAACDAEAVASGGDSLSLAQGILRAARFHCPGAVACGLTMLSGYNLSIIKLRVALLTQGTVFARRSRIGVLLLTGMVLMALFVPHFGEADALEQFHLGIETLLFNLPA